MIGSGWSWDGYTDGIHCLIKRMHEGDISHSAFQNATCKVQFLVGRHSDDHAPVHESLEWAYTALVQCAMENNWQFIQAAVGGDFINYKLQNISMAETQDKYPLFIGVVTWTRDYFDSTPQWSHSTQTETANDVHTFYTWSINRFRNTDTDLSVHPKPIDPSDKLKLHTFIPHGYEAQTTSWKITAKQRVPYTTVWTEAIRNMNLRAGSVNLAGWNAFPARSVMFLGIDAEQMDLLQERAWNITWNFLARRSFVNYPVGDIIVPFVGGFDYLWVDSEKMLDEDGETITEIVRQVNVSQIYPVDDFAGLPS